MEKERFLDLTRNYTALTEAETRDLDALQKEFPYSQVIHNLASRGAQDHKLETSKALLNISAVYSTDRSVLRDIITTPRTERIQTGEQQNVEQKNVEVKVAEVATTPKITDTPTIIESPKAIEITQVDQIDLIKVDENLHGDALNDEIMHDLERLKELKHNFEVTVEEFEHNKQNHKPPTPKAAAVKKKEQPLTVTPEPSGEGLLEEIKTTKKKIVPESQKQKEQIEIIDQFIKKQPSIAKGVGNADGSDLAEKNLSLTDNIVSETLVEILLRQGKKDKAIEVLKKLIWKFPQKKAIFAAQIDELKK